MSTMTPELALVDPELRADAIAELPPIYVNAFLEFPDAPVFAVPVAQHRQPSLASAALAYLLLAVARTVVFEAAVFAAVAVLVFLASLFA